MFRLLQQAHQTLSDPAKRAQYDRSQTAPPPPPTPPPPPPRPDPGPASDLWGDQSGPSTWETPARRGRRPKREVGSGLISVGIGDVWLRWHGQIHVITPAVYAIGAGSAMAARWGLETAVIPPQYELIHPALWWIAPAIALGALIGWPLHKGLVLRPVWSMARLLGCVWIAIAAGEYIMFLAMVLVMLWLMLKFIVAGTRA
jgi:hypothetical protein